MRYHVYKGSRVYEGRPYQGPSSNGERAEADSLEEVIVLVRRLMAANSGVGWNVRDTQLGRDLTLKDYF